MKGLMFGLTVVLAAAAQVTVAPLFPLGSAVADVVLVTLALGAAFGGPRLVMFGLPLAAVCLGFASGRAPGLLLLGYLPLLPLAVWIGNFEVLLGSYVRWAAAAAGTGIGLRMLLALGALTGGAEVEPVQLLLGVLLPGMFLDLLLLSILYLPFRLTGMETRELTLRRGAY